MSDRAIRKIVATRPEGAEDHDDKISKIREILFGEQVRDFDWRFSDMEQRMEDVYVLFPEGFELDVTDRGLIDDVARDLHELLDLTAALDRIPTVTIVGRTDAVGTPAYNSHVGREKAFRVAGYLSRQKDLLPGMLRTEVRLPQERDSGENARMRRVEFELELRSDGRE